MGYFLLSLSVAANITIVQNIFIYLVFYSLVTIGIFCCLHLFRSYSNFHFVDRITLLNNLSFTNPTLAILFSILLFSLIGLPPFILFFSKFILLSSLISDYILLFVFVILLCLSVYYYLRIIKIMFFFRKSYFLFLLPQSRTLTILLSSIVCVIMLAPFFIDVFVVCLQNGFFNF